ncbi:transmembrane emp24 domain-containing protein p24beta3-like [Nymphaea colorata]|nr:transmembrane emp24 domain-containing protein p24beta3-like [Nymphaea colorata]
MGGRAEQSRRRPLFLALLVSLGLLISDAFLLSSALTVTLNDVECISEYVISEGDIMSGSFVVDDHDAFWRYDQTGIDFSVISPSGNVVYSLDEASTGQFRFKAPASGMYKICFHNPSSTYETVTFYIHTGHIPNEQDPIVKDEHLNPLNVKIAELREALESVTAEQKYLKAREERHWHTNTSTRRRLYSYTVVEYMALLVTSIFQVVCIRQFFSQTVAYNRI